MKQITWTTKAVRQFQKIKDLKTREMIYSAIGSLQSFPNCMNVKKLPGRKQYRLRVGQWRVLFKDSQEVIIVKEVRKRDEHTYRGPVH